MNTPALRDKRIGIWPALYCLWAVLAIVLSIVHSGFSPDNVTRLLVIAFLLGQIALRSSLVKAFPRLAPRARFIVLGTILAAVVEGFHMISIPVFLSLRIGRDTSFTDGLINYGLDLVFTVPAYLVIFWVIWCFINRYQYAFWQYVVVVAFAQLMGDGGIFYFMGAPAMLMFLPYPMTNYHAMNVVPLLAVRDHLARERSASAYAYLVVPAVIGTYLICGATIKALGRYYGLEAG